MQRVPPHALPVVLLTILLGLPLAASFGRAEEPPPGVDLSSPAAIKKALAHKEPGVRLAAAQAAANLQDPSLIPPLARALGDDVQQVREAAAVALAGRQEPKDRRVASRAVALLLRPLDREPSEEDLAREALLVPLLHDLAQVDSIKRLLEVHTEGPIEPLRARLRAVANVPAKEAIEALIDYGARRRAGDGHRRTVGQALRYATGQDLGSDPDRWRQWWREAEPSFDFEAAAERRAAERAGGDRRDRADRKGRKKAP